MRPVASIAFVFVLYSMVSFGQSVHPVYGTSAINISQFVVEQDSLIDSLAQLADIHVEGINDDGWIIGDFPVPGNTRLRRVFVVTARQNFAPDRYLVVGDYNNGRAAAIDGRGIAWNINSGDQMEGFIADYDTLTGTYGALEIAGHRLGRGNKVMARSGRYVASNSFVNENLDGSPLVSGVSYGGYIPIIGSLGQLGYVIPENYRRGFSRNLDDGNLYPIAFRLAHFYNRESEVFDVLSDGAAVGFSRARGVGDLEHTYPFLHNYDELTHTWNTGYLLNGEPGYATAMNAYEEVIGIYTDANTGASHGFYVRPSCRDAADDFIWQDIRPGASVSAENININGLIVGTYLPVIDGEIENRAYIYKPCDCEEGDFFDLTDMVQFDYPDLKWTFRVGKDINDRNRAIGYARDSANNYIAYSMLVPPCHLCFEPYTEEDWLILEHYSVAENFFNGQSVIEIAVFSPNPENPVEVYQGDAIETLLAEGIDFDVEGKWTIRAKIFCGGQAATLTRDLHVYMPPVPHPPVNKATAFQSQPAEHYGLGQFYLPTAEEVDLGWCPEPVDLLVIQQFKAFSKFLVDSEGNLPKYFEGYAGADQPYWDDLLVKQIEQHNQQNPGKKISYHVLTDPSLIEHERFFDGLQRYGGVWVNMEGMTQEGIKYFNDYNNDFANYSKDHLLVVTMGSRYVGNVAYNESEFYGMMPMGDDGTSLGTIIPEGVPAVLPQSQSDGQWGGPGAPLMVLEKYLANGFNNTNPILTDLDEVTDTWADILAQERIKLEQLGIDASDDQRVLHETVGKVKRALNFLGITPIDYKSFFNNFDDYTYVLYRPAYTMLGKAELGNDANGTPLAALAPLDGTLSSNVAHAILHASRPPNLYEASTGLQEGQQLVTTIGPLWGAMNNLVYNADPIFTHYKALKNMVGYVGNHLHDKFIASPRKDVHDIMEPLCLKPAEGLNASSVNWFIKLNDEGNSGWQPIDNPYEPLYLDELSIAHGKDYYGLVNIKAVAGSNDDVVNVDVYKAGIWSMNEDGERHRVRFNDDGEVIFSEGFTGNSDDLYIIFHGTSLFDVFNHAKPLAGRFETHLENLIDNTNAEILYVDMVQYTDGRATKVERNMIEDPGASGLSWYHDHHHEFYMPLFSEYKDGLSFKGSMADMISGELTPLLSKFSGKRVSFMSLGDGALLAAETAKQLMESEAPGLELFQSQCVWKRVDMVERIQLLAYAAEMALALQALYEYGFTYANIKASTLAFIIEAIDQVYQLYKMTEQTREIAESFINLGRVLFKHAEFDFEDGFDAVEVGDAVTDFMSEFGEMYNDFGGDQVLTQDVATFSFQGANLGVLPADNPLELPFSNAPVVNAGLRAFQAQLDYLDEASPTMGAVLAVAPGAALPGGGNEGAGGMGVDNDDPELPPPTYPEPILNVNETNYCRAFMRSFMSHPIDEDGDGETDDYTLAFKMQIAEGLNTASILDDKFQIVKDFDEPNHAAGEQQQYNEDVAEEERYRAAWNGVICTQNVETADDLILMPKNDEVVNNMQGVNIKVNPQYEAGGNITQLYVAKEKSNPDDIYWRNINPTGSFVFENIYRDQWNDEGTAGYLKAVDYNYGEWLIRARNDCDGEPTEQTINVNVVDWGLYAFDGQARQHKLIQGQTLPKSVLDPGLESIIVVPGQQQNYVKDNRRNDLTVQQNGKLNLGSRLLTNDVNVLYYQHTQFTDVPNDAINDVLLKAPPATAKSILFTSEAGIREEDAIIPKKTAEELFIESLKDYLGSIPKQPEYTILLMGEAGIMLPAIEKLLEETNLLLDKVGPDEIVDVTQRQFTPFKIVLAQPNVEAWPQATYEKVLASMITLNQEKANTVVSTWLANEQVISTYDPLANTSKLGKIIKEGPTTFVKFYNAPVNKQDREIQASHYFVGEADYESRVLYCLTGEDNAGDFETERLAVSSPSYCLTADVLRDGARVCFSVVKKLISENANYVYGKQKGIIDFNDKEIEQYTQRLWLELIYSPRLKYTEHDTPEPTPKSDAQTDYELIRSSTGPQPRYDVLMKEQGQGNQ